MSSSASSSSSSLPSCPCCVFLPNDLFLPENLLVNSTHKLNQEDSEEENNNDNNDESDKRHVISNTIMWSPQEALEEIKHLLMVDTHCHAHLERTSDISAGTKTTSNPNKEDDNDNNDKLQANMLLLTCAVDPSDWQTCLDYASRSTNILPGIGVHPWYIAKLEEVEEQQQHDNDHNVHAITANNYHLTRMELLLQLHPHAIVGEIGLCKVARHVRTHPKGKAVALDFQRQVFLHQFRLAAKYQRPTSIHCVQLHAILIQLFKDEIIKEEQQELVQSCFPPTIAMHSFTGTAHHVKEILQLETKYKLLQQKRMQQKQRNSSSFSSTNANIPTTSKNNTIHISTPRFYFGFSHFIHSDIFKSSSSEKVKRQTIEAIRAVPYDRLLVESDESSTKNVPMGTAGAIAILTHYYDSPDVQELDNRSHTRIMEMTQQTTRNGIAFLQPKNAFT